MQPLSGAPAPLRRSGSLPTTAPAPKYPLVCKVPQDCLFLERQTDSATPRALVTSVLPGELPEVPHLPRERMEWPVLGTHRGNEQATINQSIHYHQSQHLTQRLGPPLQPSWVIAVDDPIFH